MIVNLFVIFLTIILGLYFLTQEKTYPNLNRYRKNYIILICIILILQSGLRNVAVGADTYAYFLWFENVKQLSWAQIFDSFYNYYFYGIGKDPGYDIFQKLIQYIIPSYQLFLFAIAIIFFSSLGNFILKNTSSLTDAMFAFVLYSALFYSFYSLTGHRQTLATAATLYGFELIKKQKLLPFLILILIASTIHRSCLIFIPFYFISKIKKVKQLFTLAILILPVLFIYKNNISGMLKIWGGYSNYEIYEGAGTYTFTALLVLIALIGRWRIDYVTQNNPLSVKHFNAFIFALIFTPLTWVNPSAMRIVQYFSIFMLVLIPLIIKTLKDKTIELHRLAYIVSIIMLIFLTMKGQGAVEYKFFWQEMPLGANYRF